MKLAVIEAPATLVADSADWENLCQKTAEASADILVLNELPFGSWLSARPEPDADAFRESVNLHDRAIEKLSELGARAVLGSKAAYQNSLPVNEGFVWTKDDGYKAIHTKQFFPNEPGYYEARWFERGDTHFRLTEVLGIKVGFLICTEVMFNEWARYYGKQGAQLIVCPRATELKTEKWQTALGMAAIASACYVASSNRRGEDELGLAFGGKGMIHNPRGSQIAETSESEQLVTAELDLAVVEEMKQDHPFNVEELPQS